MTITTTMMTSGGGSGIDNDNIEDNDEEDGCCDQLRLLSEVREVQSFEISSRRREVCHAATQP